MVIYAVFPKYPPLFSAVAAAYEKPRWPLPDNSGEKQQKARRKAVREGGLLHRVVQIPPSPIFSLDKYPHRVYTEPIKHGRTLPMSCCETGKTKDRSQAEVRRLMNRRSRSQGEMRVSWRLTPPEIWHIRLRRKKTKFCSIRWRSCLRTARDMSIVSVLPWERRETSCCR